MILSNCFLRLSLFIFMICLVLIGCTGRNTGPKQTALGSKTLFTLLPSSQTGVHFTNTLFESDTLNILNEAYLYNGGGVGIGDFNNDGWTDLYFTANMGSNKLYLNKGSFRFADITEVAGVTGEGRWCTGVSVVDINADGWLDLYVSTSFLQDAQQRKNLLYINQGIDDKGTPVFKESAVAYGLADTGYSTQSVFFDYDQDGDLDMYLLTNALHDPKTPIRYRPKVTDGSALNTDRLYRNNGDETFTNVSVEAGILLEGWGHAVSVSDINQDGWPDIYVSNDFVANDILYINNQDGTFTDRAATYFKHTSWFTMGTDVADINNDGRVDVVALDMLPEDNLRKKTMLNGNEYMNYFNSRKYGYQHQYIRNVLQLNQGMAPDGHPVFSEVGYMAGIYQTDWSWAPLVADFDNDGYRDLVITNGLPRDVTDLDYIVYENGQGNYGGTVNATLAMVEAYFPVVKIPNYAFKNTGGLLFADSTSTWGLDQPSFSNGAAYADLDNDGDLDLAVNNINEPAFLYENTLNSRQQKRGHYLSVALKGTDNNPRGIGATIHLYYAGGQQQFYEHQPSRGYLSTVDSRAHFGLGTATRIDSLRVRWPDGKDQRLTQLKVDQSITISYEDAEDTNNENPTGIEVPVFATATRQYGLAFKHREKDAIDFNIQRTLPHKLSQYGPGIAVGDIDNNGQDDLYIGGAAGHAGVFFLQDQNGQFLMDSSRILQEGDVVGEAMGVLLFDADHDHDQDLYVVNGSYEFPPSHPASQDHLYLNNGKGVFQRSLTALPEELSNGSCVRAADFDRDGDLDLFIGGRSVSGAYPVASKSALLENQGGIFVDVTRQYCPQLQHLGMITDALWSDFDQDGRVDLVLAGEWMPVTFLRNVGHGFVNINASTGIDQRTGWWNSLVSGDFDNDGDIDYVAGNLGFNSHFKASASEPMTIYAKDLDENGRIDPMLFCYMKAEDGTKKPYPMHTRDDLISQLVSIRKLYPTYKDFGRATEEQLWSPENRQHALVMKATELASCYVENQGNGKFNLRPLPAEAQAAPLYGMVSEDVDRDGNLDLLLVGNDYGMDPVSGRHDAFTGLYLKGDGRGNFSAIPMMESGFYVHGDAKGLAKVHTARGNDLWVATQNQDSLMVYRKTSDQDISQLKWLKLNPDDFCADIQYKDQSKRYVEFYYGSTYLSQSSRRMILEQDAVRVTITDFKGNKREVMPHNKQAIK